MSYGNNMKRIIIVRILNTVFLILVTVLAFESLTNLEDSGYSTARFSALYFAFVALFIILVIIRSIRNLVKSRKISAIYKTFYKAILFVISYDPFKRNNK